MKRLRGDVLAAVSLGGMLSLSPGRPGWHSDSLPLFAVPLASRHLVACHRVHVEVQWTRFFWDNASLLQDGFAGCLRGAVAERSRPPGHGCSRASERHAMCGADATSLRVHHAGMAPSPGASAEAKRLPGACLCGPHVSRRWPIQYAAGIGSGSEGELFPVKGNRPPTQNTSGNSSYCSARSTQVCESDPRQSSPASSDHRSH